ncbi:MAG TPA: DNA-formamidopyrimidine glycosylase family protein [Pseudolysinimonas sp.]|nr:DNA-formamidopyrimidine glycosylase family protein [Pseudolysinimonas sp.]
MPELPEVQALVADLGSRLTGGRIARLDVTAFAALKTYDPAPSVLTGATVTAVTRHGKFLDLTAVGAATEDKPVHLIIHLARAGWLRWRENAPAPGSGRGKGPIAARLVLDDGSGFDLTEAGTKKSLAIYVVRDPAEVPGIARLGPDPLEPGFTADVLAGILKRAGRSRIKGVLRDQSTIAGIGNAYSDEILHVAKMSPFKAADMPPEDVQTLYAAMQSTLRDAIARADGVSASELKAEKKSGLRVHGRTGEPCPVCGDTVRQVIYSDSTFQYCPTCQTGGKPLADRVLSRLLK